MVCECDCGSVFSLLFISGNVPVCVEWFLAVKESQLRRFHEKCAKLCQFEKSLLLYTDKSFDVLDDERGVSVSTALNQILSTPAVVCEV